MPKRGRAGNSWHRWWWRLHVGVNGLIDRVLASRIDQSGVVRLTLLFLAFGQKLRPAREFVFEPGEEETIVNRLTNIKVHRLGQDFCVRRENKDLPGVHVSFVRRVS